MLSPLPRHSDWDLLRSLLPSRVSLPRYGSRVGLRIVLFEACSAFTRVTACTLALSPIRDTHSEGFSYFVTSIAAPVASGWSGRRVGLAPTGKRRLVTAHAKSRLVRCSKTQGATFFFGATAAISSADRRDDRRCGDGRPLGTTAATDSRWIPTHRGVGYRVLIDADRTAL
jgi:hypothetical protein